MLPVPKRSRLRISSLDLGTGAFLVIPGPIMARLLSAFFYFLAFSLINVFMTVGLFVG